MLDALKAFWKDEDGTVTVELLITGGIVAGIVLFAIGVVIRGSIFDASGNVADAIDYAGREAANGISR
ncbi:hypothetical protein [Caldalkalibacillus thermarum]|uniref:hypothetical protein n=1 Tax=Caldalkalibacillus thermarum TaxID=296745 RepID=UPI00166481A8|nr:hypothetical protein [Caldalkalibacillus thermarum]